MKSYVPVEKMSKKANVSILTNSAETGAGFPLSPAAEAQRAMTVPPIRRRTGKPLQR